MSSTAASTQAAAVEIVPGKAAADFRLGTLLIDVVRSLQHHQEQHGVVHVSYASNPQYSELILRSSKKHMFLHFDRVSLLLEKIVLGDLSRVELLYRGTVLCNAQKLPTFSQIYEVLGPTFQGDLNASTGLYTLRYPGIEIDFDIPPQYHSEFTDRGQHPTKLPNGATPIARSVTVLMPLQSRRSAGDAVSIAPAIPGRVIQGDTVQFDWMQSVLRFEVSRIQIPFGVSPQHLMKLLGAAPYKMFGKVDNRLGIHNTTSPTTTGGFASSAAASSSGAAKSFGAAPLESHEPSYFLNYPALGMDFEFGWDHRLEKIVLHNPLPSFETFLRYQRCNYSLDLPLNLDAGDLPVERCSKHIDNSSLWSDGDEKHAADEGVRSLISSSGCSNGLVLKIYAFNGVVLYVMPATKLIVKVLLVQRLTVVRSPTAEAADPRVVREQARHVLSPVCGMEAPRILPLNCVVGAVCDGPSDSVSPMHRSETIEGEGSVECASTTAAATVTRRFSHHHDPENVDGYVSAQKESFWAKKLEAVKNTVCDDSPGDDSDTPDDCERFSVPPPYGGVLQQRDCKGSTGPAGEPRTNSDEQYDDDFTNEDDDAAGGSSRQHSLRSSSYVPSVERSPFLPSAAHSAVTDIESWHLPHTFNSDGGPAHGDDPSQTAFLANDEEVNGAQTAEDAEQADDTSPAPRALSPASQSASSVATSNKSKKGKKKKK